MNGTRLRVMKDIGKRVAIAAVFVLGLGGLLIIMGYGALQALGDLGVLE